VEASDRNPSGPDDWDFLIMVELKNWAALDGLNEKFEAIQQKIVGGDDAQRQLATKRIEVTASALIALSS
jgi:hypothetical protein